MKTSHIFAGNPLDRAERERRDEAWIEAALRDSNSRFLPFYNLDVPLLGSPHSVLCWLTSNQLWSSVPHADPVLLGNVDATAHFAVDLSNYATAIDSIKNDLGWRFENCRTAGGLLTVSETGILAQGRSQIDWHARHGFCSICGSQTVKRRGGQVRQCSACKADHFPRTDPVVITIVGDLPGNRCLLGQSHGRLSRTHTYSAIAGFVDQGETLEEAVSREVMEEAGIRVKNIRYHSSQPWPFPSSLMLGCIADAKTTTIQMDSEEMSDVRWFDRREVLLALNEESSILTVPGPVAIAHHLIKAWATSTPSQ